MYAFVGVEFEYNDIKDALFVRLFEYAISAASIAQLNSFMSDCSQLTLWRIKLIYILYKYYISDNTEDSELRLERRMLRRETTAVHCRNHMKQTDVLCAHISSF